MFGGPRKPEAFNLPWGLGKIHADDKGGKAAFNIPFYGKVETQWGEPPTPPSWADRIGDFFKKAGLVVLGVVCGAVALGLLPLTAAGIISLNVGESWKQNAKDPIAAHNFRVAGRILALPYYAAKGFLQDAGIIPLNPIEEAFKAADKLWINPNLWR